MKSFLMTQIDLVVALMRADSDNLRFIAHKAKRGNVKITDNTTRAALVEIILLRVGDEDVEKEATGRFSPESSRTQEEKKKETIAAVVQLTKAEKSWFPSLTPPSTSD